MPELSADLLERIRRRANDPDRRNDAPPSTRGQTVTAGGFSVVGIDLGALLRGAADPRVQPRETALPPPLDEDAIAAAEARLGTRLPAELRQLYTGVADGGFGPGPGLLPLDGAVSAWRDLTASPPGQRGQTWPVELLPLSWNDPGYVCIDMASGRMIFWDEEELADGPSDKVWRRSFKDEAPDLATWLQSWLGAPSPEEKMQAIMEKAKLDGIRASLSYWRGKTVEERVAFGLPETGWEQAMFGHLGIDLDAL